MSLHLAAYASQITLICVFLLAGITKLLDVDKSRDGIESFGLPRWAAKILGVVLPLVELAAAIALLAGIAFVGEAIMLGLLVAFIAAIAINIGLGRKPVCSCFGAMSSKPVGWGTLARNFGLVAVAVISLLAPRERFTSDFSAHLKRLNNFQQFSIAISCAILGAILYLVLKLFRKNSHLIARLRAIKTGRERSAQEESVQWPISVAYRFDLPNAAGGRSNLDEFIEIGKPILLLFLDSNCGGCNELLPEVSIWQEAMASDATIVVVSRGEREAVYSKAAECNVQHVLFVPEEEVQTIARHFGLTGTPSLVSIRHDGILGGIVITGQDNIRQFILNETKWTDVRS
jgi:uncharacterized membrane protein YphA (DoxX/SURF4 family)/thiol-disulfide isomerase/thioredoxin